MKATYVCGLKGKQNLQNRVSNLMYPGKRKMKILTPPLPLPYKGGERLPLHSADETP